MRRSRGTRVGVLLLSAALVSIATRAEAEHPWRFSDPSKVLYKIKQADPNGVPAWMFPFIRDAADAWSETPTPLHLINCPSNNCSLVVRAYPPKNEVGGEGGCLAWDDSTGYCAPNQGYVQLNIGCTGATCGPQQNTPRYNKWMVMHELAHAIGLTHSTGKHSVTSYGSCTSETGWCVSHPNSGDAHRVNLKYPVDWSDDGGGASCSIIRTAQDHSGSSSTEASASYWERILGWTAQASELAGQSAGKTSVDSPLDDKLTFHPSC